MADDISVEIALRLPLERARAELAAIVRSSEAAIISKTLDGEIVSWNKAAEKIYGYSASEVIGRPITILCPPRRQKEIRQILARVRAGEFIERFETTRLRKDGSEISISLTMSPVKNSKGEIIGASAISSDITEQRRIQFALQASEKLFRELVENIDEVFWLTDPDNTKMFYVGPAYERVFGRSRASLYAAPKSWMDCVDPEDKAHVFAAMGRQPCTKAHDLTYRITRPDGAVHWIRDRGFPVHDESGAVVHFAGLADDITQAKHAEEALRARESELAKAQRVAKIGSWRLDLPTDTIHWSDELYRIFEITKSDLTNYQSFLDRVHPDDRELVSQASARARKSGTKFDIEYRIVAKNGKVKVIREEGLASRDDQGNVKQLFGVAQDVTERVRAERTLRKTNLRLRRLSRRYLQVQEDEEKHLARELHDQIGQALTATKLSILSAKRARDRETKARRLDDAIALVDQTLLQVRQLTLYLRPHALDDLGLVPALRLVLHDYAKRGHWDVTFSGWRESKTCRS